MKEKDLNILVINDLCSYGKAALTINIPIFSHFGISVSPLVSVILSNHTGFNSFYAYNITDKIANIVEELKLKNINFDALYIGWLGIKEYPSIIIDIIKSFNFKLVFFDPILGDNGKLYSSISNENINAIKELLKYANIITPNITELAILLDKDPKKEYSKKEILNMIEDISKNGTDTVITTSVMNEKNKIGCIALHKSKFIESYYNKINLSLPGTGDAFGSALLSYILKGYSFESSLKKATKFIYKAVKESSNDDRIYGLRIEKMLHLL